ncbi:MAG: iron-sulfur cluster repair di-iron protein [Ignavibacteria bacterium]|nr:MAG: iron-sulfur cluster repair di-iron protein [Ignavibacteria bacterium]
MNSQTNKNNFSEYKTKTLSEIVTDNFHTAVVFEKYNLDYCCNGKRQFEDACMKNSIDPNLVIIDLEKINNNITVNEQNYDEWELDFLIDYIINNHHQYIRRMIPLIAEYGGKAAAAHSENHPELLKISEIFAVIYKDLKQHMLKEEQILFPFIKQIVQAKKNKGQAEKPYFGSVQHPIRMMEAEHENAGDGFREIRRLSEDYKIPADACSTYSAFYNALMEFEKDLHKHIHLENNILFPKAITLENEML